MLASIIQEKKEVRVLARQTTVIKLKAGPGVKK